MGASYEKLGIYGDALKAYQKVLEIDPENSDAADSLASIKDIANSGGSASKHILALNLGHGYLLNGSGLIEVFDHDRNEML